MAPSDLREVAQGGWGFLLSNRGWFGYPSGNVQAIDS
jgi:hypothetical protein